jgi:Leucine-rich repeat (LRR) protein
LFTKMNDSDDLVSLSVSFESLSASLNSTLLSGLTQLKTLSLNNNKLLSLPADIFKGLYNLERLYIFNNALTTLDVNIFKALAT